jgi:hypothetical protein
VRARGNLRLRDLDPLPPHQALGARRSP